MLVKYLRGFMAKLAKGAGNITFESPQPRLGSVQPHSFFSQN
jgi:hypothetical protein